MIRLLQGLEERERERPGFSLHIISQTSSLSPSLFSSQTLPAWISLLAQNSFNNYANARQGNAQYSMEMDWRENGLIKDRWHECWKPFVIDAGRHFRQRQNLTDVRYGFHSQHYLLWGGGSWLFRPAEGYKRVFSKMRATYGSVRLYIPFFA